MLLRIYHQILYTQIKSTNTMRLMSTHISLYYIKYVILISIVLYSVFFKYPLTLIHTFQ